MNEFEFRPDRTTDYGVTCPWASKKYPHRPYNGENGVFTFSLLFLIGSFWYFHVTRTSIKAWMSSNFLKWDLTLAHWTQVSDRCPLGYLYWKLFATITSGVFVEILPHLGDQEPENHQIVPVCNKCVLKCFVNKPEFLQLAKNVFFNFQNHSKRKWATTRQNQQNECAPSEDSYQPGHPPSLISVFAVRMKKAWALSYLLSAQRRLWSDWADAQADLSLRWAHTHFVGFVMSRLKYCFSPITTVYIPIRIIETRPVVARQANLCLRAFRHDKF